MDGVRVGCSKLPDGSLVLYIVTVAHVLGLWIVVSETLRRHSAAVAAAAIRFTIVVAASLKSASAAAAIRFTPASGGRMAAYCTV